MHVHLLTDISVNYKGARIQCMAGIWIQCRVQQIVCRHCFLATIYTGYDSNKGQVLASVYYHYYNILSSFTIHKIQWDKCSAADLSSNTHG